MENIERFKIPQEAVDKLRDPDVIRRYVAEGKTFQEIIGYSPEIMEEFYGLAYRLYSNQQYEDAADAFVFLTTLNPYVHNFWLGLGMAEQKREEYEGALIAYGMAGMTDPSNPISLFHSSHCYHLMGEYQSALDMMDRLIKQCGDQEEHAKLKADAAKARSQIERLL